MNGLTSPLYYNTECSPRGWPVMMSHGWPCLIQYPSPSSVTVYHNICHSSATSDCVIACSCTITHSLVIGVYTGNFVLHIVFLDDKRYYLTVKLFAVLTFSSFCCRFLNYSLFITGTPSPEGVVSTAGLWHIWSSGYPSPRYWWHPSGIWTHLPYRLQVSEAVYSCTAARCWPGTCSWILCSEVFHCCYNSEPF